MTIQYAILLTAWMLVLIGFDFKQTLAIAHNPERWYERNPILGRHPSPAKVIVYFLLCIAATIALPFVAHFYSMFKLVYITLALLPVEAYVVWHNYKNGIR